MFSPKLYTLLRIYIYVTTCTDNFKQKYEVAMREETRAARRAEIEAAAYDLLAQNGYGGTSMLSIAKSARASNETLYRWYGDKQGLFKSMVNSNAATIRAMLEQALADQDDPLEALARIAPVLLAMLLDDRAILLNRAAAADPSGELGAAIAQGGRDAVVPLIQTLVARVCAAVSSEEKSTQETTERFLSLLIGDLQIRRAIGVLPRLTQSEINHRAQGAQDAFLMLVRG